MNCEQSQFKDQSSSSSCAHLLEKTSKKFYAVSLAFYAVSLAFYAVSIFMIFAKFWSNTVRLVLHWSPSWQTYSETFTDETTKSQGSRDWKGDQPLSKLVGFASHAFHGHSEGIPTGQPLAMPPCPTSPGPWSRLVTMAMRQPQRQVAVRWEGAWGITAGSRTDSNQGTVWLKTRASNFIAGISSTMERANLAVYLLSWMKKKQGWIYNKIFSNLCKPFKETPPTNAAWGLRTFQTFGSTVGSLPLAIVISLAETSASPSPFKAATVKLANRLAVGEKQGRLLAPTVECVHVKHHLVYLNGSGHIEGIHPSKTITIVWGLCQLLDLNRGNLVSFLYLVFRTKQQHNRSITQSNKIICILEQWTASPWWSIKVPLPLPKRRPLPNRINCWQRTTTPALRSVLTTQIRRGCSTTMEEAGFSTKKMWPRQAIRAKRRLSLARQGNWIMVWLWYGKLWFFIFEKLPVYDR